MTDLRAEASFPFNDLERATSALRGDLRLQAAYADGGPQVPDWTTLVVMELEDDTDDHGRTWWRWSGTVTALPQPAVAGSRPTRG